MTNPWDAYHAEHEGAKYPSDSLIRFCARYLYGENARALELGCGNGRNVWYMAREGIEAYGIDGSEVAIERARARLRDEGVHATVKQGSVTSIPFHLLSFDAILDEQCLYATDEHSILYALQEAHRVLKSGGLLYSRTFASFPPYDAGIQVRVTTEDGIDQLYGAYFTVESVDKIVWTKNNAVDQIAEWVIVARKE